MFWISPCSFPSAINSLASWTSPTGKGHLFSCFTPTRTLWASTSDAGDLEAWEAWKPGGDPDPLPWRSADHPPTEASVCTVTAAINYTVLTSFGGLAELRAREMEFFPRECRPTAVLTPHAPPLGG